MIVKGIIKTINYNDNSCTVRLPLFETVATSGEVILSAVFMSQPGMYNGYAENDVVFVDFENDSLDSPIVIGKLYLGATAETASAKKGGITVSSLNVSSDATLPVDTKIAVDRVTTVADVDGGITSYKSIADMIKALRNTGSSIERLDKQNDELKDEGIASIKVEYLSQPRENQAPLANDKAWQISSPEYKDGYAIWQKTTWLNYRGQILNTEIICLSELASSATYRIKCSTRVHYGKQQKDVLVVTAMAKFGSDFETRDTREGISLLYKWGSGENWILVDDSTFTIELADIQNETLFITAKYNDEEYNDETITYVPLNTPTLSLSSDSSFIEYDSYGLSKIDPNSSVQSKASVKLNNEELDGVTFNWTLDGCKAKGSTTSQEIVITDINQDVDIAYATCEATYTDNLGQSKILEKTFTIAKNKQGKSFYKIDIFNDSVIISTDENGTITDSMKNLLPTWSSHDISCYYGDDLLPITEYKNATDVNLSDWQYDTNFRIVYAEQNVTIIKDSAPTFAISELSADIGYIIYTLYRGTNKVAVSKFEIAKQLQGVAATSYWIDYSARVHKGTNQQDDITATAWKKYGNSSSVQNNDVSIRYGWRHEDGNFSDYSEPNAGQITVNKDSFKNADLIFELGTIDENGNFVISENDSEFEVITYSPLNTPVLDLSNDSADLTYKPNGEKIGTDEVSCIATVFLNGEILTEGVNYAWTPTDEDNVVKEIKDENNKVIGSKIIVSKLASNTVEFTCTATIDNPAIFKNKIELQKVFTIARQIQGENSINYWLKLSSGVHLGTNQQKAITVTAMQKVGTNAAEDVDESATLFYTFNKNESWNQVPGRVVGEGENAKTYYDTFDSSKIDRFKFEDSDLLIKAMHGENEYETESITYSPLNTPTLDLDNDTDTILYPAKPEDDINGPLGAPVKSKATLYLNGDELDATYSWILEDCSASVTEDITTVTNNQTITVAALKDDTARAICTATVTAEGAFKGKIYEKAFTVSKTRKGDNAVTYSLVLNYSSISVNPNFGTKVPEKLVGTWYIHDGENIQPFKTKFEYKIDTEINFIEDTTDDNGKFEISTENIDTEIVLRLKVNNTIVKNETVSVIRDGENTVDYWLAPSHNSIIRDNNTASWYPNDIYVDVIKQRGMSPAEILDLSEETISENFTLKVAVDDELLDLSNEENKNILTITDEGQYKVSLNSAPTSKLSLTLYTIVDNIEYFAYCINIGVVRDGTSNYSLDIFNDFVSIPADENGDCYTDYDWSLTEHSIKAYYGDTPLALASISDTTPTDTDINKYHLKYAVNNIVFANNYPKLSADNKTAEIRLADSDGVNYTTVPNKINYELYKGNSKVASGKFELSKLNDGIKATSYWITTTSSIHKGTNQQSPLELTTWSKHGDEETKVNNELFIRYSWRSEDGTFSVFENIDYANGGALRGKITINNFVDADLCIQTSYKEDFSIINDTEIITYAPAGTPILDLENDYATLSYYYHVDDKQVKKINSDEVVSTTAKVYLDGNELTNNVTYSWSCSDAQASYDTTDNSIIVSEIKDGHADFTCTATLSDKSLFKEDIILTKVFTVAKQIKGDPSISYWLKTSTPVHTGSKQSEDLVVTAMHKIGEGTEGVDENALLFYCWADRWTNEADKTWTAVNRYTFTIPRSECKDLELFIKATHDKDLTKADIYKVENKDKIFDEETITYSPLNTPVLDLDNEIDDLSYSADGTTLLNDAKVISTATLFLNGKALPDTKIDESTTELVKYVWTVKSGDCKYELSDNNKTITVSEFAENVNKSEIICTATYKGESYTKILTINKKLKGDNAIYYAIKPEHSTIVYNAEAKTWNPSTLRVNFYIYDGSTASLFDNCKITYTIDNNKPVHVENCANGILELGSSNIRSQVSISLYDANKEAIVDTEVIKVLDAAEAPYKIDIFNDRVTAITNTGKLDATESWWESMTTHTIRIFRGSTLLTLNDDSVAILDSFDESENGKYYQLVRTKTNINEIKEVTDNSSNNTLKTYYITGLTNDDKTNPNDLGIITYDLYANKNLVATSAFEFTKITTGISIISVTNKYYATKTDTLTDEDKAKEWSDDINKSGYGPETPYLWNYEIINYSSGEPTITPIALLGSRGKGIKAISEYYLLTNTNSAPDEPTKENVGNWKTGESAPTQPTAENPYLWNSEKIEYTDGDIEFTDPALIGTYSRSITSVKNYYLATTSDYSSEEEKANKPTHLTTGWVESINAADFNAINKYLWNYEEIFYDRALEDGTTSKKTTPELISIWSKEVKEIKEFYLISKSMDSSNFDKNANNEADWAETLKTPTSTYPYLWNKETTYYTDNTNSSTAPIILSTFARSIIGVKNYYVATKLDTDLTNPFATTNSPKTTSWQESITAAGFDAEYKYLWNYEEITYDLPLNNGESTSTTDPEIISTWSKSINKIEEFYLISESNGSDYYDKKFEDWNSTVVSPNSSYPYLWNKETTYFTDGTSETTEAIIIGTYGETFGVNIIPSVSSIKYKENADGSKTYVPETLSIEFKEISGTTVIDCGKSTKREYRYNISKIEGSTTTTLVTDTKLDDKNTTVNFSIKNNQTTGIYQIQLLLKNNNEWVVLNTEDIQTIREGNDGTDATSYWLSLGANTHLGTQQKTEISVRAMKKVGANLEVFDDSAYLWWYDNSEKIWKPGSTIGQLNFNISEINSNIGNDNLRIVATHISSFDVESLGSDPNSAMTREEIYDFEVIDYAPLNTATLVLNNDADYLVYDATGITKLSTDLVSSTAKLTLNNEEVANTAYVWKLKNCTSADEVQKNSMHLYNNKVTISDINLGVNTAAATCCAFNELYEISAIVNRDSWTEAQFVQYSTDVDENWTGTTAIEEEKYFIIIGKATDTNKTWVLWYQSIGAGPEGQLRGKAVAYDTYVEKDFSIVKQRQGNKGDDGVSIESQTTYYALIHPIISAGYVITPENTDEGLIIKAYKILEDGTKQKYELYSTWSAEENWNTTPPTHNPTTINEGWKYWTTVRTKMSNGNIWFSNPIINEAVSGAYKLAQGKTTTYYSDNDPAGNPIHNTYGDGMVDGDCWFGPSYIDQGAFKEYENYIGYYLKNGNIYDLVTEDNLQVTIDGRGIDLGVEHAYSKGQVLQRWNGENKMWEDVSSEIVANKVTANYINAMDITAKKIEILDDTNSKILFKANGLDGNHEVEIAGFKITPDYFIKVGTTSVSKNPDTGGDQYPGIGFAPEAGKGSWAIWAGPQSGNGSIESVAGSPTNHPYGQDAPFKVGHDGKMYSTQGEIGGFIIDNSSIHSRNEAINLMSDGNAILQNCLLGNFKNFSTDSYLKSSIEAATLSDGEKHLLINSSTYHMLEEAKNKQKIDSNYVFSLSDIFYTYYPVDDINNSEIITTCLINLLKNAVVSASIDMNKAFTLIYSKFNRDRTTFESQYSFNLNIQNIYEETLFDYPAILTLKSDLENNSITCTSANIFVNIELYSSNGLLENKDFNVNAIPLTKCTFQNIFEKFVLEISDIAQLKINGNSGISTNNVQISNLGLSTINATGSKMATPWGCVPGNLCYFVSNNKTRFGWTWNDTAGYGHYYDDEGKKHNFSILSKNKNYGIPLGSFVNVNFIPKKLRIWDNIPSSKILIRDREYNAITKDRIFGFMDSDLTIDTSNNIITLSGVVNNNFGIDLTLAGIPSPIIIPGNIAITEIGSATKFSFTALPYVVDDSANKVTINIDSSQTTTNSLYFLVFGNNSPYKELFFDSENKLEFKNFSKTTSNSRIIKLSNSYSLISCNGIPKYEELVSEFGLPEIYAIEYISDAVQLEIKDNVRGQFLWSHLEETEKQTETIYTNSIDITLTNIFKTPTHSFRFTGLSNLNKFTGSIHDIIDVSIKFLDSSNKIIDENNSQYIFPYYVISPIAKANSGTTWTGWRDFDIDFYYSYVIGDQIQNTSKKWPTNIQIMINISVASNSMNGYSQTWGYTDTLWKFDKTTITLNSGGSYNTSSGISGSSNINANLIKPGSGIILC